MEYLLEVDGVRKAFPGVLALDGVSMNVRPGSVHALMGENGAGKSTLMKIIAGLYEADAGVILAEIMTQARLEMVQECAAP